MSQRFLYLFVFITGATVMSTEMTASRLIAPYFGTSIIVWANIIGIILLAMSAGYFFGGRLADRHPEPKLLFSLSIVAGIILTAIPLISQGIFHFLTAGILATPISITIIAFVCTLLVFAPPIFLLAMVSPFALRLSSPSTQDAGKISGRLNAFSTLGSLLGTFLPSLVLIPSIGTKSTIYCASFILIMISAIGLKRSWTYILALIPLLLLFLTPHIVKANQEILWEKETPYQYVQVIRQEDDSIALVYNEGGGVQSISRPNHGLLPQDYYDYYLLLPFLRNEEKPKVWILGSAGGTMLSLFNYWVRQAFPALSLTGVEIDPEVIPLGKKFFGLDGTEGQVVNADARTFLNSRSDKTDLVIVDAYTQQIYIPFHLSTQEFYQMVQEHLNPGGILAMNINAIAPSSPLLQAFLRTLESVFKYTYVLSVPGSLNYVLLATDQPISNNVIGTKNMPPALKPYSQYFQNNIHPAVVNDGFILTDDRAPVEFLTDQMIWDTLRGTESPDSLQLPILSSNDKSTQSSSVIVSPFLTEQQFSQQSSLTAPIKDSAPDSPSNSQNLSPTTNADAFKLYEQGLKLYYKREFPEALTFFDKALIIDTRCYQALNAKGATYAFQGKYDEGLTLIKQALEINPNFVYGHFNLGLANELAGRWDPAITAYQEALRLDKQDVWSYYGIASIYGRKGNVTKVVEYLAQAIALDPGVKEVAREEKDFDPVRQDPGFQKLVTPTE